MALYVDIEKKCGDFLLKVKFTAQKEVLGLLGASGCGKSMTLKCIAGIEKPDKGVIRLDDKVFFDSEKRIHLPVQKRRVGYLFQDYALFPNMTVLQNILCSAGDRKKASEYVKRFFLDGKEQLYPAQLSGGQKQRTAMARMLAGEPEILMLDEPFTALDNYYRQYVATGGMPEVVQKYIDTKDFREVDRVQRSLLQGYQYDIAHYATAEEKVKAEKCYLSLAKQLLDKENHKFQYKEIEHGGRAQKYYSSVEWLLRADMVQLCKLVTDVRFDLDDYARDDFFRAYTTDLSLLMAMKDFSLKQHIVENTLAGNSKGGIYECAIADALYKKGYHIYFYKNETTKREIDVIIQKDGSVVPIEVKSGNTRANSLKWLMKNDKDISYGYKFVDGNIGMSEEGIVTLPLYMSAFI